MLGEQRHPWGQHQALPALSPQPPLQMLLQGYVLPEANPCLTHPELQVYAPKLLPQSREVSARVPRPSSPNLPPPVFLPTTPLTLTCPPSLRLHLPSGTPQNESHPLPRVLCEMCPPLPSFFQMSLQPQPPVSPIKMGRKPGFIRNLRCSQHFGGEGGDGSKGGVTPSNTTPLPPEWSCGRGGRSAWTPQSPGSSSTCRDRI